MSLSVIIPCYNENPEVLERTVNRTCESLDSVTGLTYEVIVVFDKSERSYDHLNLKHTRIIKHEYNQSYSASLMTGIIHSKYPMIGITDSDRTYPVERFHEFVEVMSSGSDMVIGRRAWKDIPAVRLPAKYILHQFACFMAGHDVIDLNTGMRIFNKNFVLKYRGLFPKRFSFTSTLTMISLTNGLRVRSIDIHYKERIGRSSIKPISDTVRFFSLVLRLSLFFNPLKVFIPSSFLFLVLAVARGIRDVSIANALGGLSLVLFFMSFQIFFFGLLAEIINRRSS
ncbi:MAG: glycosyltransferase [Bdellovibrionales bacterium]|nr:glycosyltransferase [Bdellovibrionales bacterium]